MDGNAETADISTKAMRLPKYVRYVPTQELILKEKLTIIKRPKYLFGIFYQTGEVLFSSHNA